LLWWSFSPRLGPTWCMEHGVLTLVTEERRWVVRRRVQWWSFGIDGEWLQGSSGPGSSPGGSGDVSCSSMTGRTRLRHGEMAWRRAARGELDGVG
jgi:hypothetical protein